MITNLGKNNCKTPISIATMHSLFPLLDPAFANIAILDSIVIRAPTTIEARDRLIEVKAERSGLILDSSANTAISIVLHRYGRVEREGRGRVPSGLLLDFGGIAFLGRAPVLRDSTAQDACTVSGQR